MIGRYCVCCCSNPDFSRLSNLPECFQNALVRQLQEENLYLRHQLTSGPVSGDMFDNVKDTKSNHPVMRTRLKQAASCIARLSREKQQLIEMANSLRAQITTARLHGMVTDTLTNHFHTHTALNHILFKTLSYNKPAELPFIKALLVS